MRRSRAGLAVGVLAALMAVPTPLRAQEAHEVIEPLDLGLTERTGRQLMFLDVEAVDEEGRPLPGLLKDDFRIKLDYAWRELYSVDNLCPCSRPADASEAGEPQDENDPARLAVGTSERVFVLYFDFSALQIDGRVEALDHARRWVRDVKKPEDRTMIVAYSSIAGLETRCRLTTDREELLRVLDEVDADPAMLDPFPSGLADRIETCRSGTVSCYATARRDYFQIRRSFRTLMYFFTLLDDIPERKVMLLFHQNNVISPGRLYAGGSAGRTMLDGSSSGLVPDHLKLLGRLAGTATSSRTAVYPIVSGSVSPWGVNVGANLADFTGGSYNRGGNDIAEVIDDAGRGCSCIYRLGLRSPERKRSKVFRAKIRAGDTVLPSRYRLQYMTDYDRWERRAMAVLNSPQDATALSIDVGVVPVTASEGRWQLSVQVAFDVRALSLVPEDGKWVGAWEVGALLSDERGRQTWEMLAVSRIVRDSDVPSGTTVLHERTFDDLAPGTYELRAFVRDRTANVFGGARADVDLPAPGGEGMAGPLIMRPRQTHLRTGLPFLKGKRLDAPWQGLERQVGSIPLAAERFLSGRSLQFATWACPANTGAGFERTLVGEDRGLDPSAAKVTPAGDCVSIRDEVETSNWPAGTYTYRVLSPDAEGPSVDRSFEIAGEVSPE